MRFSQRFDWMDFVTFIAIFLSLAFLVYGTVTLASQ
jgi:hypothetical protein